MGDNTDKSGFDIKFAALPPDLQLKLWVLALDANTSRVNLAYKPGAFVTSLSYNYGGSLDASMSVRRFSAKVGVDPSNRNVDLGLVYRGYNFSASTNLTQPNLGIGLTYGTALLPMPYELFGVFNSAGNSLTNMAGSVGSLPNNPLDWYNLHSDDISTIGKAVGVGQQISKYGKEPQSRFGFGLRMFYLPQKGLTIYGGAQFTF